MQVEKQAVSYHRNGASSSDVWPTLMLRSTQPRPSTKMIDLHSGVSKQTSLHVAASAGAESPVSSRIMFGLERLTGLPSLPHSRSAGRGLRSVGVQAGAVEVASVVTEEASVVVVVTSSRVVELDVAVSLAVIVVSVNKANEDSVSMEDAVYNASVEVVLPSEIVLSRVMLVSVGRPKEESVGEELVSAEIVEDDSTVATASSDMVLECEAISVPIEIAEEETMVDSESVEVRVSVLIEATMEEGRHGPARAIGLRAEAKKSDRRRRAGISADRCTDSKQR